MPFSQRSIKKIIKNYHKDEISSETIIYLRNKLIDITKTIALNGVKKFKEKNKLRENLGLKPKKRLDKTCFKNITDNILKEITDKNMNKVDDLLCQDGAKK